MTKYMKCFEDILKSFESGKMNKDRASAAVAGAYLVATVDDTLDFESFMKVSVEYDYTLEAIARGV